MTSKAKEQADTVPAGEFYALAMLTARLAEKAGYPAGLPEGQGGDTRRLIVTLPTGQVSWDIPSELVVDRWPLFLRALDDQGDAEQARRIAKYVRRRSW